MFKFSIILLASVVSGAFGGECANQGIEKCQDISGTSPNIIVCDLGREIIKKCPQGELCYGSGRSEILCINPKKSIPLAKRSDNSDPFGEYSTGINDFLKGMNGDAVTFKKFIKTCISAMFTNKDAVQDMSASLNRGLGQSKKYIGENSKDLSEALSTSKKTYDSIYKARLFTNSINSNLGDFSYLVYDVGTTVSNNGGAREGLAGAITTGYTAVSDYNPKERFIYDQTYKALLGFSKALNQFYPKTLGKVMYGDLAPEKLVYYLDAASKGNTNGTANVMSSVFNTIAPGHDYMPAFTHSAGKLGKKIAYSLNPTIVKNVMNKYKPTKPHKNAYVNIIIGATNAIVKTKGKYEAEILSSYKIYFKNVEPDCGCKNETIFAQLYYYLALLCLSVLVTPTGACCVPGSGKEYGLQI
ncbi:hypothetical protein BB561_003146 [Smittium simulii]|uniref:Uncharacterized protein n=1 Tax=Smittium simulii TaxID=133385 RepID=A0A2T9YMT6_9FUNG|nr:hypothetical protein BB561_003146 [Smittium simulii]